MSPQEVSHNFPYDEYTDCFVNDYVTKSDLRIQCDPPMKIPIALFEEWRPLEEDATCECSSTSLHHTSQRNQAHTDNNELHWFYLTIKTQMMTDARMCAGKEEPVPLLVITETTTNQT